MDWTAFALSVKLGVLTIAVLLPLGVWLGRLLAYRSFRGKPLLESLVALPLVLPPTVLGYYLLVAMGAASPLGKLWAELFGSTLVFSFGGLLVASVIVNIPFAVQPMQRAFEAIDRDIRDAAACCGMNRWDTLRRIELPLAWPGILTACVLSFAHTLGEFGVVLMVGGSIPGETKTISIAIYDRVQAFDDLAANRMAALLLVVSLAAIAVTYLLSQRIGRRLG
jgi:molybdate transport system permease protein